MKLNENNEIKKRLAEVGTKEHEGTLVIDVRSLIEAFYADKEVKSALERLAK